MSNFTYYVPTLALGLRPRPKGLQGCGPQGSPGVTSHTPGNVTLTLPRQLPLWEMESQWIPETLESDFRGQNSLESLISLESS